MSMSMLRRDSGASRSPGKVLQQLLGAITTIVASIAWQLVASAFLSPSCPTSHAAISALGSAWLVNKTIAGYQRDEVYIGTAEERAAKDHADDDEQLHMGPGP
jgi:hypothetical protein